MKRQYQKIFGAPLSIPVVCTSILWVFLDAIILCFQDYDILKFKTSALYVNVSSLDIPKCLAMPMAFYGYLHFIYCLPLCHLIFSMLWNGATVSMIVWCLFNVLSQVLQSWLISVGHHLEIGCVLLGRYPWGLTGSSCALWLQFIVAWLQLKG